MNTQESAGTVRRYTLLVGARPRVEGEYVEFVRATAFDALLARAQRMEEALQAQEAADDHRMNCEECGESTRDWSCCPLCSPLYGRAIDMRRAALEGK